MQFLFVFYCFNRARVRIYAALLLQEVELRMGVELRVLVLLHVSPAIDLFLDVEHVV